MSKKSTKGEDQTVYIRPSIALSSLTAYNSSVFLLLETCRIAIQHGLVDPKISNMMKEQLNQIEKFHQP